MTDLEELAAILLSALEEPARRLALVRQFQERVWNSENLLGNEKTDMILTTLADVLDLYQPNPEIRKEEALLYGEERFEQEVRATLRMLAAEVPPNG